MLEFFDQPTEEEKRRQMEFNLPDAPYTDQSELICDWFRFFDAMRGQSRGPIDPENLARWIEAHQDREKRLWQRWDETEQETESIPIIRFVRDQSLSKAETKILLYIFYRTVGQDQSGQNPFRLLRELYGSYRSVFEHLPLFDQDQPLLKNHLITERSAFHDDEYVLSEPVARLFLGFDKTLTQKKKVASNDQNAIAWVTRPTKTLKDVILADNVRWPIEHALIQFRNRKVFDNEWGFDELLEKGKGVSMLFYGPPGTGKTLTAEAVAGDLGRPLATANVAGILDKWMGGTEKNIVEIFQRAEAENAVLLLDEADSFLGSRLTNDHYNTRSYNREVSLFLKTLEEYKGIVILTTNLAKILDPALERRINPKIEFGLPDYETRVRLWHALVPKKLPLDKDVDLETLADRYELTGGQIKNAVVSAARTALANGTKIVTMRTLVEAIEMERGFQPKRAIGFA